MDQLNSEMEQIKKHIKNTIKKRDNLCEKENNSLKRLRKNKQPRQVEFSLKSQTI